ncbi:MAG: hypothetical protein M3N93_08085 [Acidobacteriota bacterium]|nr:hypothetical protein [Acidobacteriota bacterium]
MPTEKELLERIRQLEEQNSLLHDKLDMIYAILAPEYEESGDLADPEERGDAAASFVQIEGFGNQRKLD